MHNCFEQQLSLRPVGSPPASTGLSISQPHHALHLAVWKFACWRSLKELP